LHTRENIAYIFKPSEVTIFQDLYAGIRNFKISSLNKMTVQRSLDRKILIVV